MTDEGVVYIDGKPYDITQLTLGEVEDIEETFDAPLDQLDWGRAKVRKLIVLTLLRRDNPDLTEDEVRSLRYTKLLTNPPANGDSPD